MKQFDIFENDLKDLYINQRLSSLQEESKLILNKRYGYINMDLKKNYG